MKEIIVAPSLLAADPMRFGEDLKDAETAGATWHHVDVMDGHFVPNLTYGIPFVAALKKTSTIPLDVHIMVSNPDEVALDYVRAGADILVFHIEAARHAHRLIESIHQAGARAGVAINPGTSLQTLEPVIPYVDLINVMSVNPGFGGQSFIREAVGRVAAVAAMIANAGRSEDVAIEVDGGVNDETGAEIVRAGARALVAGSWVYGAPDRRDRISRLKDLTGLIKK